MANPANTKSYNVQFIQMSNTPENTHRDVVAVFKKDGSIASIMNYINKFIMTQMTGKAGIKKHGKVAIDALYDEFWQLLLGVSLEAPITTTGTSDQTSSLSCSILLLSTRVIATTTLKQSCCLVAILR